MSIIKKGFFLLLLGLMPVLSLAPAVFAAETTVDIDDVADSAGYDTSTDLSTVIGTIINIVLGLLGIILLVIVLYAGFLWMTAGGKSEQVDKAKDWLINGVIGLVLVLAAYAIANFVIDALSEAGLSTD